MSPKLLKAISDLPKAQRNLRQLLSEVKDRAILKLAESLDANRQKILNANVKDLKKLPKTTPPAFRDRLTLNSSRIDGMIESLRSVARLADPVGEFIEQKTLANGLKLHKVRAPLGVIFIVFEARPNVITEAFSLAFKSGNCVILRGGSDSSATSAVIYKIMSDVFKSESFSPRPFVGIEDYNRKIVDALLVRKDIIDIVVPRGGPKLIEHVQKKSLMPIIKNDRGLCHAYVHADAELNMALQIVTNAKTQRPGVCNALETVLVHRDVAAKFIPKLFAETEAQELNWRVDPEALKLLKGKARVKAASKLDWDTEHLDLVLNCRVVRDIEEAIAHIEKHGSKHSEAIITNEEFLARRFQAEIDAAVVYWNASTRFTDGFEFGLGGELGISTQKLHVRGPVGLRELTSARWIIDGTGQTRG